MIDPRDILWRSSTLNHIVTEPSFNLPKNSNNYTTTCYGTIVVDSAGFNFIIVIAKLAKFVKPFLIRSLVEITQWHRLDSLVGGFI